MKQRPKRYLCVYRNMVYGSLEPSRTLWGIPGRDAHVLCLPHVCRKALVSHSILSHKSLAQALIIESV